MQFSPGIASSRVWIISHAPLHVVRVRVELTLYHVTQLAVHFDRTVRGIPGGERTVESSVPRIVGRRVLRIVQLVGGMVVATTAGCRSTGSAGIRGTARRQYPGTRRPICRTAAAAIHGDGDGSAGVLDFHDPGPRGVNVDVRGRVGRHRKAGVEVVFADGLRVLHHLLVGVVGRVVGGTVGRVVGCVVGCGVVVAVGRRSVGSQGVAVRGFRWRTFHLVDVRIR